MNIEWREISYGSYEVSNDAKVRRYMIDDAGKKVYYKLLTPQKSSLGDLSVNIIDHNHRVKKLQLARLVAEAFDLTLRRRYIQAVMQKELKERWNIWTGILRDCVLLIWWTMICFTVIGEMWTAMQRHLPFLMKNCLK